MFKIGNVVIKNKIGLAPMAGISNPAYIKICEEMGIGFAVSELISAEGLIRDNEKTFDMLKGFDRISIPVGIQIFGSNADNMAAAAKAILKKHPYISFIDINMGCPVPKVAIKSKSGSHLLKEPEKVREIVSKVVESVSVPVTVKIRSGWDNDSINAPSIAKICEEAGACAITIHGRTRSQGYSGTVSLDIIKKVKESVSIPVVGNGDVNSIEKANEMFATTKCDAIMIGRAARGNPWIFKEILTYINYGYILPKPNFEEKIFMCKKHLKYLLLDKSEKSVILEMRSHISWYIKSLPNSEQVKNMIFKAKTIDEIDNILNMYLKEFKNVI